MSSQVEKCPDCGKSLVPIVYGSPHPETFDKADRGELILGGCCVSPGGNDPSRGCVCGYREAA